VGLPFSHVGYGFCVFHTFVLRSSSNLDLDIFLRAGEFLWAGYPAPVFYYHGNLSGMDGGDP
jgi:hypothetical protein